MTIPSANIKWGDIYNVVNNTVHNGISPSINIGSYIGQVWRDNTSVPNNNISIGTHFRNKSMPSGGPEYPPGIIDIKNFDTIILNEKSNGKNYKYDPGSNLPFYFTDSGESEDYSSREKYHITFWTPNGLRFWVNSSTGHNYFKFEEYNSSQYDRLGLQVSNNGTGELINFQEGSKNPKEPWLQTSVTPTIRWYGVEHESSISSAWSRGFGGQNHSHSDSKNGYIFPGSTTRAEKLGQKKDRSLDINYTCIRFYFDSDGSGQSKGWYFSVYPI